VEYEINLNRLTTEIGEFLHLNEEEVLRRQIADGLRAQLQMESMVTGILYIELTYRPDATPPAQVKRATTHPEIPTTPSLLAAFGTEAGSLVADVLQILFRVNEMLEEVDMQGLNAAVVASAQAVERLVGSPELQAAINEVPGMAEQLGRTLTEFEILGDRLSEAVGPLTTGLEETLSETTLTVQAARRAIEDTRGLITTDSGIGYGMDQALISLREAAEALRTLVITLERNPDMLIRGTNPPGR
jgi:paraquat-inducible protein B